jgi:hypothetical protein
MTVVAIAYFGAAIVVPVQWLPLPVHTAVP